MSDPNTITLRCYRCHRLSHLAEKCTEEAVVPYKEDVIDSGAIRLTTLRNHDLQEWQDSAVTHVARLPWRLSASVRYNRLYNSWFMSMRLKCSDVSTVWRYCKVRYEFRIVRPDTGNVVASSPPTVAVFDASTPCIPVEGETLNRPGVGGPFVYEVHFEVLSVGGGGGFRVSPSTNFREPTTMNADSVVLSVDGQRVCVLKSVLVLHSAVFREMFQNGDKQDAAKEIPLTDVVVEEFVELMRVVHPEQKRIDVQNVWFLMRLADKFEMPLVLSMCEMYLCASNEIDTADKLVAVGKYSFAELHSQILRSFTSAEDIKKLRDRKNEFSAEVKASLFDEMVEYCKC